MIRALWENLHSVTFDVGAFVLAGGLLALRVPRVQRFLDRPADPDDASITAHRRRLDALRPK